MRAALGGDLLQPAQLDEMLAGIFIGEEPLTGSWDGPIPKRWAELPGFQTRNTVKDNGTTLTVSVTALPWAIFAGPEEGPFERYLVLIDTSMRFSAPVS